MKKTVKIDENFYLISHEIIGSEIVTLPKAVHHIVVIDVSGSMSYELPEIRKNLKNKISSMVKENDRISIIWFSGRNDAGILKEDVQVNSLKQLNELNIAIDRFLRPIGLTAFAKPLELAKEIIGRTRNNTPSIGYSLVFMSDGYNNDVQYSEVIKMLNAIAPELSSATVVEYGYSADSQRLTEMSALLGGSKIFAENFEDYDIVLAQTLKADIGSSNKVSVDITDKYLYDFAFSVTKDGSVLLYNIVNNQVLINSDVKEIHFFSSKAIGEESLPHTAMYAAVYVLSDKLLFDDSEKVISALGDNYYYKMLSNAYGKQKLNAFKTAIKECVGDVSKRFPEGLAKIKPIDENAYCLMNLIEDLGTIDGCLFYPNNPEFKYNRIGRKRVAAGSILTEADKKRLSEAKNVDEATIILKELEEKKVDVKFVNTNPERGYPLTDMVFNEERANLSLRIFIEGEVILPANKFNVDKVASFKYNTFTLIKDGIVNVEKLPVSWSEELYNLLISKNVSLGVTMDDNGHNSRIIIDLNSLPIINKSMVKSISANALAKQEWELVKIQGEKKVYDYYKKSLFPKTSKLFVEMLGQECADWLKEIGVTDYNGFAPKVVEEESTDFYMSVNLATKIKGLSSLPKVEDVIAKLKDNKPLKISEWVMSDAILKYQAQTESDLYKSLSEEQQKGILKTYLTTKSDILNKQKRKIMQAISEIKFSLTLSKRWFTEFKSFDENKLSLKLDGQEVDFTFELSEKEQKI